ncbi:hypothetical protein [Saccharopolyspora rectivirgula]|jgi:hypothetical protein|uniref:hypothetical protein n=1 Tax=Saccharopolyspora rectivirgula TaxID=28042 RepID=UPI00240A4561|nr:hypothetical protein [Saccharopolyspora rectivirgula]
MQKWIIDTWSRSLIRISTDAVAEAVGEDNEETANAIVDALARRLAESKSEGQ